MSGSRLLLCLSAILFLLTLLSCCLGGVVLVLFSETPRHYQYQPIQLDTFPAGIPVQAEEGPFFEKPKPQEQRELKGQAVK